MTDAKHNPIIVSPGSQKSEGYKRSNHPDFATIWELKAKNWTGYRMNKIAMEIEVWLFGRIIHTEKILTIEDHAIDRAIERAGQKAFHL